MARILTDKDGRRWVEIGCDIPRTNSRKAKTEKMATFRKCMKKGWKHAGRVREWNPSVLG